MTAVLAKADALIVVSSGSVDGARSASATLDWLDAHGHEDLVRNSVCVINAVRPCSGKVDMQKVVDHFSGGAVRCWWCRSTRTWKRGGDRPEAAQAQDPRGARRTGGCGRRRLPRRRLNNPPSAVVVVAAEPPEEFRIVVGPDDARLGPIGLATDGTPADVDHCRDDQDQKQVEHGTSFV